MEKNARYLLIACSLFIALAITIQFFQEAFYPFEVEQDEGYLLNSAVRLKDGKPIYTPIDQEPKLFVTDYPPVYIALMAFFVKIFGPSFTPARMFSFFSLVLSTLIIWLAITRRRRTYALPLALAFGTCYIIAPISMYAKVDAMGLLFSLAGLLFLQRSKPGYRHAVIAAIFFLFSAYSKHSFIMAPVAAALFLWLRDKKLSLFFSAFFGFTSLSIFIGVNLSTNWEFYYHLVKYNAFYGPLTQTIYLLISFLLFISPLIFLALIYLEPKNRGETRLDLWSIYLILTTIFSLIQIRKLDPELHYFMEFFAAALVVLGRGLPEKSRNPDLPLSGRLIFLYSLSRFYLPLLLTWIATYSLLFLGVVISKWELPYSSLLTLFEKESSDARQILNNFIQLGIFHLLPAIVLKLQFSAVSDSIESQKTLPNYRDNHLYWAGIVVAVLLLLLAALFPFPFYTGEELYDLPYDRPFLGCLAVLISVIVAGAVYPIISAIANCTIRAPKKWHYLFSSPYIWLFLFSIFNFYLLLPITTFSLPSSYENLAVDKKLQHYAKEAKGNVLDDQSSHLILAGHEGSPEKFIIKEMKDSGMVKNDDLLELCREKRYHYIIKYKEFYGVECLSQLIKFVDKQSGKPKSTSKSFPSKLNRISFQINQCFANAEDQASRYALVIIDKVKKRLDLNPHILTVFERLETQIGSNYQVYYDSMDDDPFKSCLLQDYKLIEVLPAVKGSTFIFRYPVVWLVYEKQ